MITTIQKWGNSQGVRIPKILLETMKWEENEQIVILIEKDKLVIKKAEERKNIKELFKNYNDKYEIEKIDWGEPEGKEIW